LIGLESLFRCPENLFPYAMIVLSVGAGLVYAMYAGDLKRSVYFFAAAVLTWSVT
jgi:hypothetical protein